MSSRKYDAIAKEYQEYAYIVSHDLNAPLRHLKQFSRLLIEEMDQNYLGEDQKEYIHFIEVSLEKLDRMQAALLEFSRINTRQEPFTTFSALDTTLRVIDGLKQTCKDKSLPVPDIKVHELPEITADAKQFERLMFQILDNAMKFSARDRSAFIDVSASNNENHMTFAIKDNGTGIPSQFHQEVFKMFRKLHTDDACDGTGAGLAIAHKIVDRHNGKIWIEAAPENGIILFFTLPRLKKDQ